MGPYALFESVADGTLQLGLFDESNLYAFAHPDFPGERLMACRNPVLGRLRAFKREDMLQATRGELEKVQRLVAKGKLVSGEAIGVRVGKVVDKYCMAKHLRLDIADGHLAFEVDAASVAREGWDVSCPTNHHTTTASAMATAPRKHL